MRVRIVCKAPPRSPGMQPWVTPLASSFDTRVFVVSDDGSETELEGVTLARWEVRGGSVAVAHIEVQGVELEAEGLVEPAEPHREGE